MQAWAILADEILVRDLALLELTHHFVKLKERFAKGDTDVERRFI